MNTKNNKATFTPGPWRLEKYTDRLRVQNTAGVNVAEVIDQTAGPLLAAAPELLEALVYCEIVLNATYSLKAGNIANAIDHARAAIAKAKSE